VVHHAVHGAAGDAEEETRGAELAEVAQVVAPVGLRDDGDAESGRLERAPDDGGAERRMVDVGVAGDEHHVGPVPAEALHLIECYGQEVCHQLPARII